VAILLLNAKLGMRQDGINNCDNEWGCVCLGFYFCF
jgi:hypothetical protein